MHDVMPLLLAIVGVAMIGTIITNASGSAQVVGALGNAFSGALQTATFQGGNTFHANRF